MLNKLFCYPTDIKNCCLLRPRPEGDNAYIILKCLLKWENIYKERCVKRYNYHRAEITNCCKRTWFFRYTRVSWRWWRFRSGVISQVSFSATQTLLPTWTTDSSRAMLRHSGAARSKDCLRLVMAREDLYPKWRGGCFKSAGKRWSGGHRRCSAS
jgi:hypothetical protein